MGAWDYKMFWQRNIQEVMFYFVEESEATLRWARILETCSKMQYLTIIYIYDCQILYFTTYIYIYYICL